MSCSRAFFADLIRRRSGEVSGHLVFFALALAAAALLVPLWAALDRPHPELAPWHGHEMLFGYAPAVLAGFLLARLSRRFLAILVAAWLAARLAPPLGWPLLGGIASLAFVTVVSGTAAWPFLRAARKGRNRAFAAILLGIAVAELAYQAGAAGVLAGGEARGLLLMQDLLTLLLLQMGGRIIPAATAGALARRGQQRTRIDAADAARPSPGGHLPVPARAGGREESVMGIFERQQPDRASWNSYVYA
jgi:uncharacterized protein involved in response to NO